MILIPLTSTTIASTTLVLEIFDGKTNLHLASFSVQVAITDEEKVVGLSNHSTLPEKEGLLLIFEEAKSVKIWTKFMKFPIDIIFIDKKGRISRIHHSVPPGSNRIFESYSPSSFVLELNSGDAKKFNLSNHDFIIPANILLK